MGGGSRPDMCMYVYHLSGFHSVLEQAMERRADKHVARQDDVLVRAVTRVWKARERGKLLERVRDLRLLKNVWSTWQERIRQLKHLHGWSGICILPSPLLT